MMCHPVRSTAASTASVEVARRITRRDLATLPGVTGTSPGVFPLPNEQ